MILKTVGKRKYEVKDSTIIKEQNETQYFSDIKYVRRCFPTNPKEGDCESINIHFNNGQELSLILFDYENDTYKAVYEHVYLMNDKGETVERIL